MSVGIRVVEVVEYVVVTPVESVAVWGTVTTWGSSVS
jgi:hypothetical protein